MSSIFSSCLFQIGNRQPASTDWIELNLTKNRLKTHFLSSHVFDDFQLPISNFPMAKYLQLKKLDKSSDDLISDYTERFWSDKKWTDKITNISTVWPQKRHGCGLWCQQLWYRYCHLAGTIHFFIWSKAVGCRFGISFPMKYFQLKNKESHDLMI